MTQDYDTGEVDFHIHKKIHEKLSVRDLARFLKKLSSFYRDQRFGHPALSDALGELAAALDRRSDLPLTDAVDDFWRSDRRGKKGHNRNFKETKLNDVKIMLADENLPKTLLVELGLQRFAISRSKMVRLNKEEVTNAIWSALHHEESLAIISAEAQRGGKTRSS